MAGIVTFPGSVRKEVLNTAYLDGVYSEKVFLYVTDKKTAKNVDSSHFLQGSMMYIIQGAKLYMLDNDGRFSGKWFNISTGNSFESEQENE